MKMTIQNKTIKYILISTTILNIYGCSSVANIFNPVGENKYDCNRKENPNSPYCHSFRSVEKATTNDVPDSRYDELMSITESDKLTGIAPTKNSEKNNGKGEVHPASNLNTITSDETKYLKNGALPKGTPVRIGPTIQRTWIKSFTDKNDMLSSDQIVYKEVVPTHWAGQSVNTEKSNANAGAFPHKPVISPILQNNNSVNEIQAEHKNDNTDFNQPAGQNSGNGTGIALPDVSATTMPN